MINYDLERREFRYKGSTNPYVRRVLDNHAMKGAIPELQWSVLHYVYKQTKDPACKEALKQFNDTLGFPSVPALDATAPRPIEAINKVVPGGKTLRKYQLRAVQALEYGSCLLGDDMGLGKTLAALMAWYNIAGGQFLPLLNLPRRLLTVVCPSDEVAFEWMNAITKDLLIPADFVCHVKTRADLQRAKRAYIVLIPYSRVWREQYRDVIRKRCGHNDVVVFDEAHRLSRPESEQHMFLWDVVQSTRGLRVWALSGTEVSNTPESYYGMYRMVTRSLIPKLTWMEHCYDMWTGWWKESKLKEIHVLRRGFALRRTSDQVGYQLPPCTETTCKVGMDSITAGLYESMKVDSQMQVQLAIDQHKTITEGLYLVVFGRLMQLASHPLLLEETRVDETPKYHRCCELLEEAGKAQKVIIWSNYPKTIDWLHGKLEKAYPHLTIAHAHGKVSKAERQVIHRDFQAHKIDILIANPAIWGEGVNLQAGTVMIYWDFHPSRVRWEQSKKRSHRTGQTKPVFLYKLVTRGTVEEQVIRWLERKAALSAIITGG